jgi:hypothetical protein
MSPGNAAKDCGTIFQNGHEIMGIAAETTTPKVVGIGILRSDESPEKTRILRVF